MSGPSPHVPGIDTLRGLSVVLVVLHHLAIRLPLTKSALGDVVPKRVLVALNWNGYEAVCLFFVVSGFLITTHTLARDGSPATVRPRAFYARRFARIAPPLGFLLVVLSLAHLAGVPNHGIDPARQSLALALASAVTCTLNVYEGLTGYLPGGWDVLWSLSIEEAFYLGFPIGMLALRSELAAGLVLGLFALTLPITHGWTPAAFWGEDPQIWREKAYLPAMSAIAAGVVTALVARRLAPHPIRDTLLQGVGSVAIGAVLGWGDLVWSAVGEGTLLVLVAGACATVLGAHGSRVARPIGAPLRSFGRWSYEIYLTHMFVVFAVVDLFARLGLGARDGHLAVVPTLAASWLLGRLFAAVVAEPANRALRARILAGG